MESRLVLSRLTGSRRELCLESGLVIHAELAWMSELLASGSLTI